MLHGTAIEYTLKAAAAASAVHNMALIVVRCRGRSAAGGESTLDLCYASPKDIPEYTASMSRHCNPQCGDDSILRANVTRDTGSPCLGVV